MNSSELVENLAAEIGDQIYIDVAKWHLYLRDAHLHTIVAEQLYALIGDRDVSDQTVADVLGSIAIKLGGGKKELALVDLIPASGQADLMKLLEDFQRKM
jgi:Protein of unknown function (DUF3181)